MVIPGQKDDEMSSCASLEIAGTLLRSPKAVHAAKGFIGYGRKLTVTASSVQGRKASMPNLKQHSAPFFPASPLCIISLIVSFFLLFYIPCFIYRSKALRYQLSSVQYRRQHNTRMDILSSRAERSNITQAHMCVHTQHTHTHFLFKRRRGANLTKTCVSR